LIVSRSREAQHDQQKGGLGGNKEGVFRHSCDSHDAVVDIEASNNRPNAPTAV
jgi:hypothetical protein